MKKDLQTSIILASQSPQRKLILQAAGIPFIVTPTFIDEQKVPFTDLHDRARAIAVAKAKAVKNFKPGSIIIAADTYALLAENKLEKPNDKKEAYKMLRQLSGKWLSAVTGLAMINTTLREEISISVETLAKFRPLSTSEIKRYVATQPVTSWSAGFCPGYPEGAALIEKIDGSLTGFNFGLPLEIVIKQLHAWDVHV